MDETQDPPEPKRRGPGRKFTKADRPIGGQFKKGQSGNPKGKPKAPTLLAEVGNIDISINALLIKAGPIAVQLLIDVINGTVEAPPSARVSAASKLLDKLKPDAQHKVSPGDANAALDAFVAAIRGKPNAPG